MISDYQEFIARVASLPKVPSIKDKIDWTQFCIINDPSGMVVFHIPYNYFHIWRDTGKVEAFKEVKEFLEGKDNKITLDDFLKEKMRTQ